MIRNEAIDVLKANYPDARYSELREAVDLAIKVLKEPERKKGKWIQTGIGTQCSICWYKCQTTGTPQFCPYCGADMT